MKNAVCPGSFDPVTLGHVDMFRRAAAIFEKVFVVVMNNSLKSPVFPLERRCELIRKSVSDLANVSVESYTGLVSDYAAARGAVIVKGLRGTSDFDAEMQMAQINMGLNAGVDTLFLPTRGEASHISSTAVRELARYGADISAYVPAQIAREVAEYLYRHYNSSERGRGKDEV